MPTMQYSPKTEIIIVIYVDNLLPTGPDIDLINRFRKELG